MTVSKYTRVLGLDVGDARIGVALSDQLRMFAQPHLSIEGIGKKGIATIVELVQKENVTEIVIGMPYELSGAAGEQAKKVELFSQKLRSALDGTEAGKLVKIAFCDERLTTVQAKRVTQGSGLKNRDARAALDRVSAAIILQCYLDRAAPIQ